MFLGGLNGKVLAPGILVICPDDKSVNDVSVIKTCHFDMSFVSNLMSLIFLAD